MMHSPDFGHYFIDSDEDDNERYNKVNKTLFVYTGQRFVFRSEL